MKFKMLANKQLIDMLQRLKNLKLVKSPVSSKWVK